MKPINYIICAAGYGTRVSQSVHGIPKPLIKLRGRTLLERSLSSLDFHDGDRLILVTLKEHHIQNEMEQLLKSQYPFIEHRWLELDGVTTGQLATAFQAMPLIKHDGSIAIFNCDTFFKSRALSSLMHNPENSGVIPCALEPEGNEWSFCEANSALVVSRVTEKERISPWVSVGFYYFENADLFSSVAKTALYSAPPSQSPEHYVAPLYNALLAKGKRVVVSPVEVFRPMGSTSQLQRYWDVSLPALKSENTVGTIVCDLDGTIAFNPSNKNYALCQPNEELIRRLREYAEGGFQITIYTSRRMKTHSHDESKVVADVAGTTLEWLHKHQVPFHALKFGKPLAENGFYIDDRGIRPDEFVTQSKEALLQKLKRNNDG